MLDRVRTAFAAWLVTWLAATAAALLVLAVLFVPELREGLASASWPAAAGRIVAAEAGRASKRSATFPTYVVTVRYAYEVGGRRYEGSRVAPRLAGGAFWLRVPSWVAADARAETEAEAARLRRERPAVAVFHDPADPARAVLRPGADWGKPAWFAQWAAYLAALVAWSVVRWRRRDARGP